MKVVSCSALSFGAGEYQPACFNDLFTVTYYLEGTGTSRIGSRIYSLRRNCFAMVPARTTFTHEIKTDISAISLQVADPLIDNIQGIWYDLSGLLRKLCVRVQEECESRDIAHEVVCQGMLMEIFGLAERISKRVPLTEKRDIVDQALVVIRHEEGKISVSELANRLSISPDYLRHLFLAVSESSPMQCILRAKIEKAQEMLSSSNARIRDIATNCGYESCYCFSRAFKNLTGTSPKQYRAMVRQIAEQVRNENC